VHVLSLALFAAQLGMVVHAGSHLKSDPHAPTQQQLCGECLSFSPVQAMAGAAPMVVLAFHVSHDRALDDTVAATVPRRAFTAFRSRAPPAFL
jgi:hypothetical protein